MSTEPGMVVRCNGVLHEIVGVAHERTVILRPVGASPCSECGSLGDRTYVEGSLNWRDEVEPVETISGVPAGTNRRNDG